ncbi:MAG TPA: ribosomal protein L7/L12 [Actinomycetales bacterium]|nr:ribosomal protein L7/L12 [Actinomycetales bacterium]
MAVRTSATVVDRPRELTLSGPRRRSGDQPYSRDADHAHGTLASEADVRQGGDGVQRQRTNVLSRIVRALPPVLGAILGVVIMRREAGTWLSWIGFAVFLFSVLRVLARPTVWWRYVLTGGAPAEPTDATYIQPGSYHVELLSAGERPIEVIRALREACDLDVVEARQRVDDAPTRIASLISESSAVQVCERVARAGGAATLSSAESGPP